jgi:predicted  nucleic acid-binding Zn-ribbon protein
MTKEKSKAADKNEIPVEEKLKALYDLQQIHSKIDKIRTVRGELPLEVKDLEDTVAGLETRINNMNEELKAIEETISEKKNLMKEAQVLIKKYETQQKKVRNNREYDSLTKEMEYQNLETQLAEKRIKEAKAAIVAKKEIIEKSEQDLKEKMDVLKGKRKELDDIVEETQKEEESLLKKSKAAEALIDERLLNAYKRLRPNTRNGMAVVSIQRDACGGCFNKIPPQRYLDIRTHKKVIVCEHCGRILVDMDIKTEKEKVKA